MFFLFALWLMWQIFIAVASMILVFLALVLEGVLWLVDLVRGRDDQLGS